MKKSFLTFAVAAVIGLAMVSCNSNSGGGEPGGGTTTKEPTFDLPKYSNDIFDEPYLEFGQTLDTVEMAMKYFGFEKDTAIYVKDINSTQVLFAGTKKANMYVSNVDDIDGLSVQMIYFLTSDVDADALKAALEEDMHYTYFTTSQDADGYPYLFYYSEDKTVLAAITARAGANANYFVILYQKYEEPASPQFKMPKLPAINF